MSSELSSFVLRAKDVHDFAYEIAEELETVVNHQGIEATKSLIQKVIHVLETLEASVNRIESLEKEVLELKSKENQLSSEKTFNDLEREKLKLIFEETEDTLSEECHNLKAVISTLRNENKFLTDQLDKRESFSETDSNKTANQDQENLILRLKFSLQKMEELVKEKDNYIEILKLELDKVLKLNKTLHSNNSDTRMEIKKLRYEKCELETKTEILNQKRLLLEQALAESNSQASESKEYFETLVKENRCIKHLKANLMEVDSIIKERNELLEKIKNLNSELLAANRLSEKYKMKLFEIMAQENDKSTQKSNIRKLFHLFLGFSAPVQLF